MCVDWSRTMQPGNRTWPASWSRWCPPWVRRAENRTSQGALGRYPIRNRAVPERRPVPIFFIIWLPPSAFQRWLLPQPFFLLPLPRDIIFSSSTLLHRLVYLNTCEGWSVAEAGVSHCAKWGIPQLHHRGSFKGWLLESWPYWHPLYPHLEEKGGGVGKHFYVAFKNLHW